MLEPRRKRSRRLGIQGPARVSDGSSQRGQIRATDVRADASRDDGMLLVNAAFAWPVREGAALGGQRIACVGESLNRFARVDQRDIERRRRHRREGSDAARIEKTRVIDPVRESEHELWMVV